MSIITLGIGAVDNLTPFITTGLGRGFTPTVMGLAALTDTAANVAMLSNSSDLWMAALQNTARDRAALEDEPL